MSSKGTIGPLKINRQHAVIVGEIIETRVTPHEKRLGATPLASLPSFGRRLLAGAARKRKPGPTISLWDVDKTEALAAFHYLALLHSGTDDDGFLTAEEALATREVVVGLAVVLSVRRGRSRMSRAEADRRILAWQQPAAVDEDLLVDKRWKQRLHRRVEHADAQGRIPMRSIPPFVAKLLRRPKISR